MNYTKDELIDICYEQRKEWFIDLISSGLDPDEATEQWDCLIHLIEEGVITEKNLPDFGIKVDVRD